MLVGHSFHVCFTFHAHVPSSKALQVLLTLFPGGGGSLPSAFCANLDGKTIRRRTDAVILNENTITPLPQQILINHPTVILGMDVVKVNDVPFSATISRTIKLGSATELQDTKIKTIVTALLVIIRIYTQRGFKVIAIAADYAFEAMRQNEDFMDTQIELNTTSENEHEPYSERFNRFLKERCRMCWSTLPFLRIPRQMVN